MPVPRSLVLAVAVVALAACHRLSPTEDRVAGQWKFTGLDSTSRVTFRRDHTLLYMDDDGHGKWVISGRGTWRLEGDDLVTDIQFRLPHDLPENTPIPRQVYRDHIDEFLPDKLVMHTGVPYIRVK